MGMRNQTQALARPAEHSVSALDIVIAEPVKDAIKAAALKFYQRYPWMLKRDVALLRARNIDCAIALSEFPPDTILLAAMEWITRPHKFEPQIGEWRDYCQRIEWECEHAEDVDYGRGRGRGAEWQRDRERHERAEWRKRLLPVTRQYIERRRAEAYAQKGAEAAQRIEDSRHEHEARRHLEFTNADRDSSTAEFRQKFFEATCEATATDEAVETWRSLAKTVAAYRVEIGLLRVVEWRAAVGADGETVVVVRAASAAREEDAKRAVDEINRKVGKGRVELMPTTTRPVEATG